MDKNKAQTAGPTMQRIAGHPDRIWCLWQMEKDKDPAATETLKKNKWTAGQMTVSNGQLDRWPCRIDS